MSKSKTQQHFREALSLFDAFGVTLCSMIGSSIFIVSSQTAAELRNGLLLLIAWLLAGIMSIVGALAYGELATLWPKAGGQYAYIRNIWGRLPAFLYGWSLSFIIMTGSIAAVALGFAKATNTIALSFGLNIGFFQNEKSIASLLILLLTFINIKSIKIVTRLQGIVTISNLLALSLLVLFGLILGFNPFILLKNLNIKLTFPEPKPMLIASLGIALVGPLFSLDGWNDLTFLANEVKKPQRNLSAALLLGVGTTATLYFLINVAYIAALPLERIIQAPNGVVGAALMHSIMGIKGELLITAIILIASFGCVNSMILSGSRAFYFLSQDGFIHNNLAKLNKESSIPENSLWLQCLWAITLVFLQDFSALLDYMVFTSLLFYGLTVAGIVVQRRKSVYHKPSYHIWGYPFLPIIYCLFCLWVVLSLLLIRPIPSCISLGIALTGLPFYFLSQKHKGKIDLPQPKVT